MELNQKLKHLMVEKNSFNKNYARIRINTDDDLPLNKQLKFSKLIINIRCVLQKNEKLYPQIYLDESLYELVQMLIYNGIDISEVINIKKTNTSKECKICYYWYFKDIGFNYEPHLCNGCHGLMQKSLVLMMLLLFRLKKVLIELTFVI